MFTVVGSQGLRQVREPALAYPHDETVWQAWVRKSHAHNRGSSAARMKDVMWASIVELLSSVLHVTP